MRRIDVRDVPDDVYATLVGAAEAKQQSLSAFVVDLLIEALGVANPVGYPAAYEPPVGACISLDDAVQAVRAIRADA